MPFATFRVVSRAAPPSTSATASARSSRRRCARVGGLKAEGSTAHPPRNAPAESKRATAGDLQARERLQPLLERSLHPSILVARSARPALPLPPPPRAPRSVATVPVSRTPLAVLLLGVLGVSWAAIFVRLADEAPALTIAAYRLLFAAGLLLLFVLAARARGKIALPPRSSLPLLALSACSSPGTSGAGSPPSNAPPSPPASSSWGCSPLPRRAPRLRRPSRTPRPPRVRRPRRRHRGPSS